MGCKQSKTVSPKGDNLALPSEQPCTCLLCLFTEGYNLSLIRIILSPRLLCTPQQYSRVNSTAQSNSLKDLLQNKIDDMEKQVLLRVNTLEETKTGPRNDTDQRNKVESTLTKIHDRITGLEKGECGGTADFHFQSQGISEQITNHIPVGCKSVYCRYGYWELYPPNKVWAVCVT